MNREKKKEKDLRYSRTIKGLVARIYSSQRRNCKIRGHEYPKYSKKELYQSLVMDEKFIKMFDEWVLSGHEKDMVPSIDRKDRSKGYVMRNIQLMTWKDHRKKDAPETTKALHLHNQKQVSQYTVKGEYIETFDSIKAASKKTVVNTSSISECCRNKRKTAGKFKWVFTKPLDSHHSALKRQQNIDKMTPEELEAHKRKGELFKRNLAKKKDV